MSAARVDPWRCEVNIDSGTNSRGLQGSDVLLLVWSPYAANSAWTEQEWTTALKQEVEERRIRVGVAMLQRTAGWAQQPHSLMALWAREAVRLRLS